MYQYLEFLGVSIPMYNLMIGIGTIFGFLSLDKEIKNRSIGILLDRRIHYSIIIALFFAFLGAKIFEIFYHDQAFTISNFLSGGFTFLGGFVTGSVVYLISLIAFKIKLNLGLNILVPSVVVAHAFGRIGCFLGGCCYGHPTDSITGVCFPEGSLADSHFGHVHVHPTQLYESAMVFVIFFLVRNVVRFENRLSVYFIGYGIVRFVLEFFRADDRGNLFGDIFSPSQIISIALVAIGSAIIIFNKRSNQVKISEV
jgi:phosphatidylglycerol:prolipoprotein diacylglycerol transferase